MRVLIAHNSYRHIGGEDVVVAAERALLERNGHEVVTFTASNHAVTGLASRIVTALRAPYATETRDALARRLADCRPDLVHVHNFFPLLSPSIYDACADAGVPVVQTLHNYRLVCPVATLSRRGKVCELCVTGSAYQSVLHGCYRGSRAGTLAVARMIEYHRGRDTWRTRVDRFIALTDFARRKFVEGGLPAGKISVKPNFVDDPGPPSQIERQGALFVGRLSAEKGIATLRDAWRALETPLRVAGEGPMHSALAGHGSGRLSLLGALSAEDVAREMAAAAFLVVPSECYESFPMVIAEAYAHGLPVIASRLGSLAEIVEDGVTGLHFTPGDPADLAAKARWAADNPDAMAKMGEAARRRYEERYTPGANLALLIAIYEEAIEGAAPAARDDETSCLRAAG